MPLSPSIPRGGLRDCTLARCSGVYALHGVIGLIRKIRDKSFLTRCAPNAVFPEESILVVPPKMPSKDIPRPFPKFYHGSLRSDPGRHVKQFAQFAY